MNIEESELKVKAAEQALVDAGQALLSAQLELDELRKLPENNVFLSLNDAAAVLEERLREQAYQDCQSAYNRGLDVYEQGFYVDGVEYTAIAEFEYSQHDGAYSYVESSTFNIFEAEGEGV